MNQFKSNNKNIITSWGKKILKSTTGWGKEKSLKHYYMLTLECFWKISMPLSSG